MTAPFIIITGGDARYHTLIRETVASLRALRPAEDCPIGILDGGLTAEQVAGLRNDGMTVVAPDWPMAIAARRIRNREFLRVELAKVWLARHFPGYETLIWIDADAWVQDWAAIEMLIQGASRGRLAIVSQVGRFAETEIRLDWVFGRLARVRSILFKNARRSGLPTRQARALATRPTLNAGIFALRADAPHWPVLQDWQRRILPHGRVFTSTQLGLAAAVYLDGLPVELLPETCNYMGPWRFDPERGELVEYYVPYRRLGIVHLAGEDAMRADASVTARVLDLDNGEHRLGLRQPSWPRQPA